MFLRMTNRATNTSRASEAKRNALSAVERDVLIALFQLSRDTQHISARTLAERVSEDQRSCTPTQTGAALVSLEHKGVVDATRARLTMKGLVLATQLGAGSGGPRVARPKAAQAAATLPQALPVAALPSQPPPPRSPEQPSGPSALYEEASIGLFC